MQTVHSARFFSTASSAPFSTSFHRGLASLIPSFVKVLLVACALCFGVLSGASAATIFVNGAVPPAVFPAPANDGSSWARALNTIGAALDAATVAATQGPVDIWVAGGTYPMARCNYPLANNVNIYGGFAGTESQPSERGFTGNLPTIQSTLTEPPYNYCYLFRTVGTTHIFNGIRLSAIGGILQGGGTLTAVSSTFTREPLNQGFAVGGGGISAYNGATLLVDKSLFQNLVASVGGAIAGLNAASVSVTNSTFSGNSAYGQSYWSAAANGVVFVSGGGAISVDGNFYYQYYDYGAPVNNTQVTIGGNTFTNNVAGFPSGGGAIHVEDSDTVSITNSTFGALDTNGIPIPGSRNEAVTGFSGVSNGGAISLSSSNRVTLNLNKFYGNVAHSGGAIHSQAQKIKGSVSITASKFIRNSASIGGAIADENQKSNDSETVTLDINTNTFTHNTASSKGPAIFYDNTQAKINYKTVTPAINIALINSNPTLLAAEISP